MIVNDRKIFVLLIALLAAGAACAGDAEEEPPAEEAVGAPDTTVAEAAGTPASPETAAADTGAAVDQEAAAARAALPGLFNIMIGLQGDMSRISRGLWAGRMDTVARGARAVADHPTVPPEELSIVQGILGDDIARFKSLDTRVHDLAVQMEAEARSGDMEAVLTTDARLREGCIACHTEFRERLREGIR